MNKNIIDNFSKLNRSLFFLPLVFLLIIVFFLYSQNALNVAQYVQIQKSYFILINSKLSQFPTLIYNLTQIGDALIFLSILTVFFINAPKMWEALISASLVSLILSRALKSIFSVPRPAEILDHHSFVIVGKTLKGFSSLPSGHSITIFTVLTVLLYALMPEKLPKKIFWTLLLFFIGITLISTRVGLGAHYPLDVITGSAIGYFCGLSGIFISRKYKIWNWIALKKYYPFFIALFLVCSIIIIIKIINENLIIFYFPLAGLIFSLFKITQEYVKK
ncbi:PAP2 superfamily protein [Halpernia humi]|uniref:PAP2 superfamily protein n=1 Tax=Halpernia humi TaxID=493375 RepID=A0A1H5WE73_9FLAO|nr:phosphatase PAP2 family protein [Halpernia humi]SEF97097.1 PAP2 superfamily protein [Halpernia humi]